MPETYLTGGDTLIEAKNEVWLGQSFQVLEPTILQFIDLELRGATRSPDPLISVWEADAGNIPQGDNISINRHTVEHKSGFFTTGRARFSMTPVELNTGQNYVLMVRNFPPLGGNQLSWQYDQGDGAYPRGNRIHSIDAGENWTNHPGDDFLFALFGDPPLIKPEPPPPIDNFATIALSYSHAPTSITISLITSVPCHLSCYYTDKKPLSHHTSRMVRGLAVPWGTYFCFVAWIAIEQIEAGDTMIHTFLILNWSYCQTKWFTFRGTVDLVLSPSVGPIFKHHHKGVTLYEYYNVGNDDGWEFYRTYWRAQTFTPQHSHKTSFVRLRLNRRGLPGTLTLSIQPTLDGLPIGGVLAMGSLDGDTLTTAPDGDWYGIPLDISPILEAGIMYAIAIRALDGNRFNFIEWQVDRTSPVYPRGTRCWSNNSGASWTATPASDYMFEEYG